MKKITSFIVMTVLFLSLLMVFSSSVLAEELEPVTLKIMIPGDRPADMDLVVEEAEKRMAEEGLNIKLNIIFVPFSDIVQKTQITLAGGDDIDLIFDAPWVHMHQMVAAGYYEPLEDLLEEYGQNVLATRPEQMWEANKFSGKIYGIPLGNAHVNGRTVYIRKDIREDLGIDKIKSMKEVESFAYQVADETDTNSMICTIAPGIALYLAELDTENYFKPTQTLANSLILYYKNNDGKVYNLFETRESKIMDILYKVRKWYEDGLIPADFLAIKDESEEVKSGRIAATFSNDYGIKTEWQAALEKNVPDGEFEPYYPHVLKPKMRVANFKQWNFISITRISRNKERAMMFLNWANKKDNYDLLAYGIKGRNWEAVGDDLYRPIGEGYSWFPYAWIWNPTQDRLNADLGDKAIEFSRFAQEADNFITDVLAGFTFDTSPVQNELAQYKALADKYWKPLSNGVVDTDKYLDRFENEAGHIVKRIQEEMQRQIDEYLPQQ